VGSAEPRDAAAEDDDLRIHGSDCSHPPTVLSDRCLLLPLLASLSQIVLRVQRLS
jgi:hypothetical protein